MILAIPSVLTDAVAESSDPEDGVRAPAYMYGAGALFRGVGWSVGVLVGCFCFFLSVGLSLSLYGVVALKRSRLVGLLVSWFVS